MFLWCSLVPFLSGILPSLGLLMLLGDATKYPRFLSEKSFWSKIFSRTRRLVSAPVLLRAGDLDSVRQGVLHAAVGSSVFGVPVRGFLRAVRQLLSEDVHHGAQAGVLEKERLMRCYV